MEAILCLNNPCKIAVDHFHVRAMALKGCSLTMKKKTYGKLKSNLSKNVSQYNITDGTRVQLSYKALIHACI